MYKDENFNLFVVSFSNTYILKHFSQAIFILVQILVYLGFIWFLSAFENVWIKKK